MKYKITFNPETGVYHAQTRIPLENGKYIAISGYASIADTLRDFGFSDEEVGNIFGDIAKGIGKVAKGIGKGIKKITKSKALRKVISVGKDIIKNPITTAALGAVSGGTLLAPMAAANAAVRLAEAAAKGIGKGSKAARKLLKATMGAAQKKKKHRARLQKRRKSIARIAAKNPLALMAAQLKARKQKILRISSKIRAAQRKRLRQGKAVRPMTRKQLTTAKGAADFLVNVHFA